MEGAAEKYQIMADTAPNDTAQKVHSRRSIKKKLHEHFKNMWRNISPFVLLKKLRRAYKGSTLLGMLGVFLGDTIPNLIVYGIELPINVATVIPYALLIIIETYTVDFYHCLRDHKRVIV